jgi:putative intracellular protease/amidase
MSRHIKTSLVLVAITCTLAFAADEVKAPAAAAPAVPDIVLPAAHTSGQVSVEAVLAARGKVESFDKKPLTLEQLSQLAWAVYGMAPSDKNTWTASTLEMYFVLDTGVYQYKPTTNSLGRIVKGDKRVFLAGVVSSIRAVSDAPCSIVITVKAARLGESTLLATGRASAAIEMQSLAMGLGSVTCEKIGAAETAETLGLPADEAPVCVLAVGYPANGPVVTGGLDTAASNAGKQADQVLLIVPPKAIIDAEYDGVTKAITNAGYHVTIAGLDAATYRTMTGKEVVATVKVADVQPETYEGVILLGGSEARQLYQDSGVRKIVVDMAKAKKPIGAISTAPRILASAGLLVGLKATANRNERDAIAKEGAIVTNVDVERDVTPEGGVIVTSVGGKLIVPRFAQVVIDAMHQSREAAAAERQAEKQKGGSNGGNGRQGPAKPVKP